MVVRTTIGPPSGADGGDARANFARARLSAAAELRTAIAALPCGDGPARQILQAHLALISDPALIAEVESRITQGQLTAFEALQQASGSLVARFENLADPVLQERARDLRDVCDCIARHLSGTPAGDPGAADAAVVCAAELTPAQVLTFATRCPLAFLLEQCTATSHTAILIRALAVPAVVGVPGATAILHDGDLVLVDGDRGRVILHPDSAVFASAATPGASMQSDPEPAVTVDGRAVEVTANVAGTLDAKQAMLAGAEGIGLFRTEALFLGRDSVPTEDAQYELYKAVFTAAGSRPVAARLLDIGADKDVPALHLPREPNPALGARGIRLLYARPDLLMTQMRALTRAADGRRLRLLLPMVVDTSDIERTREMIAQAARDLRLAPTIELGVMVETPAAALMAEELAAAADFISIGTNDLTQYVLAADRANASVGSIYDPLHPAVLRLVHAAVAAARRQRTPIAACGELAADARGVLLLVGMGVSELSVSPPAVPRIKALVRRLSAAGAGAVVEDVMTLQTPSAIAARLHTATAELDVRSDAREARDAR